MAGAQYTHTTRAAGTVVDATNIYNFDHQNHVNNGDAAHLGGEATSGGAQQAVENPYTTQTTQVTGAAFVIQDDIKQLRYMIGQLGSYLNGAPVSAGFSESTAAATTALGTALAQWYLGIRNPALRTVGAGVSNAAAQAITTGAGQVLTFDTEAYDQDGAAAGFHSTSVNTSRLTIPANCNGKYHVGIAGQWATTASTANRTIFIRAVTAAGATTTVIASTGQLVNAANSTYEVTLTCDISLVATDYIDFFATQATGGNINFSGPNAVGGARAWIHLIGS